MFVDDERAMPETRAVLRAARRRAAGSRWRGRASTAAQDASVWLQTILREEMWAHDEPRGPQYMNLNYIGPLIMRFGTTDAEGRASCRRWRAAR